LFSLNKTFYNKNEFAKKIVLANAVKVRFYIDYGREIGEGIEIKEGKDIGEG
jgi:hypothetical protein